VKSVRVKVPDIIRLDSEAAPVAVRYAVLEAPLKISKTLPV
jgi:hypothetical protein